jgi:DNA-binding transcriptional LysR family regulator
MTSAIASMPATLAHKYQSSGMLAVLPLKLNRLVRPVGLLYMPGYLKTPGSDRLIDSLKAASLEMQYELSPTDFAPVL